jgi:S1-C subfamily serine protease
MRKWREIERLEAPRSTELRMIDQLTLHRIRNAVCAIGYTDDPNPDFLDLGGRFTIVGTGFIVRDGIVITNRHVVDDLEEQRRHGVFASQLFVVFCVFVPATQLQGDKLAYTTRLIRRTYQLRESTLDVAFIGFEIVHPAHFKNVQPLTLDDPASVVVSEEVAVLGYPHGKRLVMKDGRVSRFGPVLQQGWVSAIAPFQGFGAPNEFLLDVRAAPGISGAPVFRPSNGKVYGMLHSAIPLSAGEESGDTLTTTAFAQPISERLLAEWLSEFERSRDEP